MNTYHLQYFLDSAKFSSISRSAEKNNVTHSAISQAIRSLEAELGVDLVIHAKRRFELTIQGKESLPSLEELLGQLQGVKAKLKNMQIEPSGSLVIWAPQSLIVDSLIEKFIHFHKKYPRVNLQIETGAAYLVRQSVRSNQCHLGIALNDQKMKSFSSKKISNGEFILVSKSPKADYRKETILVTAIDKVEVQELRKDARRLGIELNMSMTVASWGLVREFVKSGAGIGLVPEYVVKNELREKELFRISWPGRLYKYQVTAIWSPKAQLDPNAKLFLDLL